jgi:acyl-CoA hydrolase
MGNTSLDIKVDIYIELMNSDKRELAISGLFKFVAVGEDKKPIKIDINKIDN